MRALVPSVRSLGRALASLTFAVLVWLVAAPAAEPPARGLIPDAALAGQASAALAADPDLAGLNLIVDVVNGSAEVGGPVPRMELAARIETVLKQVPGLTVGKVTVWVPTPQDPLSRRIGQELRGEPAPQVKPPFVPPLVVLPPAEPSAAAPPLAVLPRPELPDRVTVQRIPASALKPGILLDPVGPGGVPITPLPMPTPATALGGSYPTIPPTAVPAIPVGSGSDVAAVRASDPRFVGLTVEVRNGTAQIAGTARRTADAWDLADALRRVPGVERVVIGRVSGW